MAWLVRRLVVAGCSWPQSLPAADGPCAAKEAPPDDLLEVGVTEHLNEQVPLDLEFVDSKGQPVKLSEYFDGQRPGGPDAQLLQLPDALQPATRRVV